MLPACVEACKEKALLFGDLEDPQSEIRQHARGTASPSGGNRSWERACRSITYCEERMLEKALTGSSRYWAWMAFLLVVWWAGFFYYLRQLDYGLGITGMSRDVSWGFTSPSSPSWSASRPRR